MITLDWAGLSNQGPVRENNEDSIAYHVPDDPHTLNRKGHLVVIADGVGGNRAGEVASAEATRTLIGRYYAASKQPQRALQDAFQETNLHICDLSHTNLAYHRMETTLSALALVGTRAFIGHVGDSRIYRIRDNTIQQLTRDHSEVGELVRLQILTPAEAQHHPRRHVITRSIGSELIVAVDTRVEDLQANDRFVLCTDGLWEPLELDEVSAIVLSSPAHQACEQLIDLALQRGTEDNLSVQIVNVVELDHPATDEPERKNGFLRRAFPFLGG